MGAPRLPTSPSTTSQQPRPVVGEALQGSHAPLAYVLIRWLFRFVLGVFYSSVVVEGEENVVGDGVPCFICANHSNSLTDALLLVTTVPSARRSLIRLTAKDTQFGRGTFSSWLIEAAGTLPIKRPKDHLGQKVDNSLVFSQLISALEKGDAVCMFPEGMSRYFPEIAPLKQGVSRIVADTLSKRAAAGDREFRLAVQTVSITYLHRNLFRSDVLVTFHPPIYVSSSTHPSLLSPSLPSSITPPVSAQEHESSIRTLTAQIGAQIRSGILDAPSWSFLRLANTARRLYAPLGTRLTLGDHVRLTQRFVDSLAGKRAEKRWGEEGREAVWKTPMVERAPGGANGGYFGVEKSETEDSEGEVSEKELEELRRDLKMYQDLLYLHGLKDDRIRNPRLLLRRTLLRRLLVRLAGAAVLLAASLPGLWLWAPVFLVTRRAQKRQVRGGPAWDTYDEIAQTKLVYGLGAGVATLAVAFCVTFPFLPFLNLPVLLLWGWLTLRFLEDLISSLRATLALLRLLLLGKRQLRLLRSMRDQLRERVEKLAVERAGLPRDAGVFVRERERRLKRLGLGRLEDGVASWLGWAGFFDPRRRRKKDWNEALKLFDQTEYAEDADDVLPPASTAGKAGGKNGA
ncbi:hypothetical protein JCM10213_007151 [Rhodosporidiobolus nylandii]